MFKISKDSVCSTCKLKASDKESLKCRICESLYHVVCSHITKDNKDIAICNKSLLGLFSLPSTKLNFSWSCDSCLTQVETDQVATLSQKITALSNSQENDTSKLTAQIVSLTDSVKFLTEKFNELSLPSKSDEASITDSVWNNTARMHKVKSAIVVKADQQGNKVSAKEVRKIVTEKGIPVNSVIESDTGELFVNLPDEESRDRVSQLLEESHASNPIVKLQSKLPSISIMGLTAREMDNDGEDFTSAELEEDIYKQNKSIAQLIDRGSVLKIVYIKPPARQQEYYTVVARISPEIRTILHKSRNKLYIGVRVHNIVDRFYVKRCNRCQEYGHYADKCKPPTKEVCGFCAKYHKSDDCPDKGKPHSEHKCSNCRGRDAVGHPAFWTKCPAYKAQQKKLEKTICFDYDSLN